MIPTVVVHGADVLVQAEGLAPGVGALLHRLVVPLHLHLHVLHIHKSMRSSQPLHTFRILSGACNVFFFLVFFSNPLRPGGLILYFIQYYSAVYRSTSDCTTQTTDPGRDSNSGRSVYRQRR